MKRQSKLIPIIAMFIMAAPFYAQSQEKEKAPKKVTTCDHNGKSYKVGQRFKDKCNSCVCAESGEVACTQVACKE